MELVDLSRYERFGILGSGADYEVRAAVDRETGQQVVLKRPKPQLVQRQLHGGTDERTERTLLAYREVGHTIRYVAPILGYTERANHDAYFGETLGQAYRVIVEARAKGIPLVGDPMSRIAGVPIGVAQNLFALFPLAHPDTETPFAVHQQLLSVEESFHRAGHVLLDLRPQNVFFQPASNTITVIDCGNLLQKTAGTRGGRQPQKDIHDFYLEMLKFYTTPQEPPVQVQAYRDYGVRPIVRFDQDLDDMAQGFGRVADPGVREASLSIIGKVHRRAYGAFADFREDFTGYLEFVRVRNQNLPNLVQARTAWAEASHLLRAEHWRHYLFDAETDLAKIKVA